MKVKYFLLAIFLVSCSSNSKSTDCYIIRYVDLSEVYAFAIKNDPEALKIKNTDTKKTIKNGNSSDSAEDGTVENQSLDDKIKKRIYAKIKIAITNVSRRHNADFIFNTGDSLIYSKSTYDVTEDVIKEYKRIIDISSPEIK